MLFDRSGGKITKDMAQIIADVETNDKFCVLLINDLRKMWDEWSNQVHTLIVLNIFDNIMIQN